MSDLKTIGVSVLDMVSADMHGTSKTIIYTVPTGYKMIPFAVIVRNPTDSLVGGSDYNFGDGADADTWLNAVSLVSMTATTDFMIITSNNVKYTIFDAGDEFGIKAVTGATADPVTATLILLGILIQVSS